LLHNKLELAKVEVSNTEHNALTVIVSNLY